MDIRASLEESIKDFHKERDKIFDQLCIGQLDTDKIKAIIELSTNQLLSHIINIIRVNATPRKTKNHRNSKGRHHIPMQNNKIKKKAKEKTEIDHQFADLVISYQNSEYTQIN